MKRPNTLRNLIASLGPVWRIGLEQRTVDAIEMHLKEGTVVAWRSGADVLLGDSQAMLPRGIEPLSRETLIFEVRNAAREWLRTNGANRQWVH